MYIHVYVLSFDLAWKVVRIQIQTYLEHKMPGAHCYVHNTPLSNKRRRKTDKKIHVCIHVCIHSLYWYGKWWDKNTCTCTCVHVRIHRPLWKMKRHYCYMSDVYNTHHNNKRAATTRETRSGAWERKRLKSFQNKHFYSTTTYLTVYASLCRGLCTLVRPPTMTTY